MHDVCATHRSMEHSTGLRPTHRDESPPPVIPSASEESASPSRQSRFLVVALPRNDSGECFSRGAPAHPAMGWVILSYLPPKALFTGALPFPTKVNAHFAGINFENVCLETVTSESC